MFWRRSVAEGAAEGVVRALGARNLLKVLAAAATGAAIGQATSAKPAHADETVSGHLTVVSGEIKMSDGTTTTTIIGTDGVAKKAYYAP
jgi:hypothetical protein